jgi:hypothetical protein
MNGAMPLPPNLVGADLKARFTAGGRTMDTPISKGVDGDVVRKPLELPAEGQIMVLDGTKTLAQGTYKANCTMVDVNVDSQGATFPFRIAPVESAAKSGNRSIRISLGSSLSITLPESNRHIGDVTVDEKGLISSIPNVATGSLASIRLEVMPVQLNMQESLLPVRVSPFETTCTTGNRLLRLLPGIPMALALGDNSLFIEGISLEADGTVNQPNGQIKAQKGAIEPVVRPLRFDAGAYVGTWRLRRYESTFAAGSRSIPVLDGDRSLTINFGDFANETAPFDPSAPTSNPILQNGVLTFNLVPVTVDPGEMSAPFRVSPFEFSFAAGKRTVQMPRLDAAGAISLISGADQAGVFNITADGTVSTRSPSLTNSGDTLSLSTLPVRIDVGSSTRPYKIMPFEASPSPGSRTVTMVRGLTCRVESAGESLSFQISDDGALISKEPRVQVAGSSLTIAWP